MTERCAPYTITNKNVPEFQVRILANEIDTAQDITTRLLATLQACDDLINVQAGTPKYGRRGEWLCYIRASRRIEG